MVYEPEIIAESDRLVVLSRGELDIEGGTRLFDELIRRAGETGLSRILIDNRELGKPLAATEKVILGFHLEGPYLDHLSRGGSPLRVAFLLPAEFFMPLRPLSDHLNSIGLAAEAFSDPHAANRWLCSPGDG